jgi:hypothetical protein
VVSTLTGTPAAVRSVTTGSTRCSSTRSVTRGAPGRVDSPPTSTRSAPSAIIRSPARTASGGSGYAPPSENESGVTFTTPITFVSPAAANGPPPRP